MNSAENIQLEIEESTVSTRTVNSERGSFDVRSQKGYIHGLGKYPVSIEVRLAKDAPAYGAGRYSLDFGASLFVDRYGHLQLKREIVWTPVARSVRSA